jgi:WD40 repeat protein
LQSVTSDTNLIAFAADAAKFVVNFTTQIATSAPHIYLSALPRSPQVSKVAQHFLPDFPSTLSVITGLDKHWPAIVNKFLGHTDPVTSVDFSSDGKYVVSGSQDNTIYIWDAETGEVVTGPFEGHKDEVTSVAFSPDGKHVASGSWDKTICIWDVQTGEVVSDSFEGHRGKITCVAFSPDGRTRQSASGILRQMG